MQTSTSRGREPLELGANWSRCRQAHVLVVLAVLAVLAVLVVLVVLVGLVVPVVLVVTTRPAGAAA